MKTYICITPCQFRHKAYEEDDTIQNDGRPNKHFVEIDQDGNIIEESIKATKTPVPDPDLNPNPAEGSAGGGSEKTTNLAAEHTNLIELAKTNKVKVSKTMKPETIIRKLQEAKIDVSYFLSIDWSLEAAE